MGFRGEYLYISTRESNSNGQYVWIGHLYKGVGVADVVQQCNVALPLTTDPLTGRITHHSRTQLLSQHAYDSW